MIGPGSCYLSDSKSKQLKNRREIGIKTSNEGGIQQRLETTRLYLDRKIVNALNPRPRNQKHVCARACVSNASDIVVLESGNGLIKCMQ